MKDSRSFMTLTHLTPHFSPPFVSKHHRTAHFPTHRTNGGLSKGRSDGSRRAIPVSTEKRPRSHCHRSHQRDGANDAGKNGAFSNRRKESSVVVLVIVESLWFFVFVYIYILYISIHQGDDSNQPIKKTFWDWMIGLYCKGSYQLTTVLQYNVRRVWANTSNTEDWSIHQWKQRFFLDS